jgi:hypothetical protein
MKGKNLRRTLLAAILCSSVALAFAQDQKAQQKEEKDATTRLRIEVTAGDRNEPVENASVYVRYVEERALRKDKKVEMNVKTNREGVARVPDVPRGKILIQVIAQGWKTYGKWYDAKDDEMTVKIRLERPTKWY